MLSQKAPRDLKLLLSFHILDPAGTGFITKKMTTDVLYSCLAECQGIVIEYSTIMHLKLTFPVKK
jgi:hypothetical protein